MRRYWLFILVLIYFIAILFLLLKNLNSQTSIAGNQAVMDEINRLLIPLGSKNITEADFSTLKNLVKNDNYAGGEVDEMILLAKYKEYPHIGHGLGFLYNYEKTGKEPVCPGHLLSHYYVFLKHGENDSANDNLKEAKSAFGEWKSGMASKSDSYLMENNYTFYSELINFSLAKIDFGNNNITSEEISDLSDAPCA